MRDLVFCLKGAIPPKKNSKQLIRLKNGRTVPIPSKRYKDWHAIQMRHLLFDVRRIPAGVLPIQQARRVVVYLFYPDNRARDNTNAAESVMDTLVDAKILIDDRWQVTGVTEFIPQYRPDDPGAEVHIELLPPDARRGDLFDKPDYSAFPSKEEQLRFNEGINQRIKSTAP